MQTIVVALGGNAILQKGETGTAQVQRRNVEKTAGQLASLAKQGYRLIITHGNGPQVGNILIQNEAGKSKVPDMPMDICGAQSQGMIGYMLQMYMQNALRQKGLSIPVATVVTQTLVDLNDPAFANPTKPVGPFCDQSKALARIKEYSESWIEDAGRGWRRVVPSPEPKSIVEAESIKNLVEQKHITICCGGGGIPVYMDKQGNLCGVEAVVEKDLSAEKLATTLGADSLIILTDVPGAAVDFKSGTKHWLRHTNKEELQMYLDKGHFLIGSMGPKVRAILRFIANGGKYAAIASLDKAEEAVRGESGTIITA